MSVKLHIDRLVLSGLSLSPEQTEEFQTHLYVALREVARTLHGYHRASGNHIGGEKSIPILRTRRGLSPQGLAEQVASHLTQHLQPSMKQGNVSQGNHVAPVSR